MITYRQSPSFWLLFIGPLLIVIVVLIAWAVNAQRVSRRAPPIAPPKAPAPAEPAKIHLITVFSANTNVYVAVPPGWQGEVFGEKNEIGALAVYSHGWQSMVLLHKDAGDWTVADAVRVHRENLLRRNAWCGDPESIKLGEYEGQSFVFTSLGIVNDDTTNEKFKAELINVVGTWIINGTIFRAQSTIIGKIPPGGPDANAEAKIRQAKAVIERIRFSPAGSIAPLEELKRLPQG